MPTCPVFTGPVIYTETHVQHNYNSKFLAIHTIPSSITYFIIIIIIYNYHETSLSEGYTQMYNTTRSSYSMIVTV